MSDSAHFFQVIMFPEIQLRQLKIPTEFVRKYGEQLPAGRVWLQAPKGRTWPVKLIRRKKGAEVWFTLGWPEFATFYSIGFGQMIVFRYDMNYCFHVVVFGISATEIDYSSDDSLFGSDDDGYQYDEDGRIISVNPNSDHQEDKDEEVGMNDDEENNGFGDDQTIEYDDDDHNRIIEYNDDDHEFEDDDLDGKKEDEEMGDYELENDQNDDEIEHQFGDDDVEEEAANDEMTDSISQEEIGSDILSHSMKSKGEITTELPMLSSDVSVQQQQQYFDDSGERSTSLKDKRWVVQKTKKDTSTEVRERQSARALNFKSTYPHFLVTMRRTYISSRSLMYIPKKHAHQHLLKNDDVEEVVVMLHLKKLNQNQQQLVLNKTWRVEVQYEQSKGMSRMSFTAGWKDFVKDNKLRLGDTCAFELLHPRSYGVTIFKSKNRSINKLTTNKHHHVKPLINKWTANINGKSYTTNPTMEKAKEFHSQNPFFVVYMHPTYIPPKNFMHIPVSHARTYFQRAANEVDSFVRLYTADDPGGDREWRVQYMVNRNISSIARLSGPTWMQFATDNGLKVGDACVFELMNREAMVYRVSIFRVDQLEVSLDGGDTIKHDDNTSLPTTSS